MSVQTASSGIDQLAAGDGLGLDHDGPRSARSAWAVVVAAAAGCIAIALASGTHIGLVLIVLPIAVAMVWHSPRSMLAVLPVWMVMLGLVRRLTPGGGNITFSGDPVLIIGPVILLLMFVMAASRGGLRDRSRLANLVLAFCVLAFLEAFNPKQGSILTGLGGLLFILVPMLAFWIGRTLVDDSLALQIVWTVAILSLLSSIYGLIQQFHGLPSWDKSWTTTKGYAALSLGTNVIRAFGPFSSAEEYAAFLSIGLVAWLALSGKRTRIVAPLHLAATATVATALWYESERTAVFLTALAIGVMFASRLHLRPIGVLIGGGAAVALLVAISGHIGTGGGGSASSTLTNHVVKGVTNPFGQGSSLPGHIKATRIGILEAFRDPIGHGTGSVTLAATRYGPSKTVGTEYDPGNMGIAFGVVGLGLYLAIAYQAFKTAYRAAVVRRDAIALFGVGMITATLMQWTNGDLYSACWLIWLTLGFLDMSVRRAAPQEIVIPLHVEQRIAWRRPGEVRARPAAT